MNEYVSELNDFLKHIDNSKDEMLDIIDGNGDYEERFDITISINGKSIIVPLNADSYYRLEKFIEDEIIELSL